ncbi:hypothetical protein [Pseudopedobacter beijingensis]|uniref:Uncharacterized protein n=1 Tax=Pseudopedobacter beijingensis TaxID=1207056 RepID=A0ABW4I8E8_9SPHI
MLFINHHVSSLNNKKASTVNKTADKIPISTGAAVKSKLRNTCGESTNSNKTSTIKPLSLL